MPVSAKTGAGVDELLDAISLQAEVMELKAVADGSAAGVVIESSLDKGRGPVATVLVQQGTVEAWRLTWCAASNMAACARCSTRSASRCESAGPSIPVQMLGLSGVPEAGDEFVVVADERLARNVASEARGEAARERAWSRKYQHVSKTSWRRWARVKASKRSTS